MPVEYGEPLSEREMEIVVLVANGLTNREIATRIYISPNTIKVHLRNIFYKTGVASRTELSMLAVKEGWVSVPNSQLQAENVSDVSQVEVPPLPWPRSRRVGIAVGLLLAIGVLFWSPQSASRSNGGSASAALVDNPASPAVEAPLLADEAGWGELAPLPLRRARLGLAAEGDYLYAVGGLTPEGPTEELDRYDLSEDRWQTMTPRPAALANVGALFLEGRLFVPGGCDAQGVPAARVDSYAPNEDGWQELAALPEPLCAYALAAYGDKAYLFGGWDGSHYRAVTYIYDPEEDTWHAGTPPTEARGFGAAAVLGERLIYVGGYNGDERATCEVYLPDTDRWELCAPMLLPRGGLGLATVGGQLYAVGGGWESYLGFSERYNPADDAWSVFESPLVGEWRNLGLVSWETSLYAVGGWSGDYLNLTYKLEVLPFRVFIPVSMP